MAKRETDRELLEDCLKAFEAVQTAKHSRNLLTLWGFKPSVYSGNRSHLLAGYMVNKIRRHLEK